MTPTDAVTAVVLGAMEEEVRPYLERASDVGESRASGRSVVWPVRIDGLDLRVVRTGIGLVNAAAGLAGVLGRHTARAVVSTGTAGGLAADSAVGDVVAGERYTYTGADATAFGYDLGQVPGMPVDYTADADLLAAVRALPDVVEPVTTGAPGRLRVGAMVSGDTFVTEPTVGAVRERFPAALSTDMESTALAQVAHAHEVPFLSVRGVSDLCGPRADQDFHLSVDEAAARAAEVVLAVLQGAQGPR